MIQRKNDYCLGHISLYMTKNTYSHGLNGLNKLNSRRKTLNNSWPNICNMTWKNENWFGTEEQGNEDEVGDNNPRWKTPKAELGQTQKGNTAAGTGAYFPQLRLQLWVTVLHFKRECNKTKCPFQVPFMVTSHYFFCLLLFFQTLSSSPFSLSLFTHHSVHSCQRDFNLMSFPADQKRFILVFVHAWKYLVVIPELVLLPLLVALSCGKDLIFRLESLGISLSLVGKLQLLRGNSRLFLLLKFSLFRLSNQKIESCTS